MTRYVAFLRAINVGGHIVKMDALRKLFEDMGLANVRTFIASGNVLFDSSSKDAAALETKISKGLAKALGYGVEVFIRTPDELAGVCAECEAAPEGGAVFVGFLPTTLDAREKKVVASLASPVDKLRVHNREVYWQAAKNFSDAVFQPAKMEKLLGKPSTFRNATTVRKITVLLTKAVLLLALFEPAYAQTMGEQVKVRPPEVVARPVTLVREWATAVNRHVPGEADAALLVTATWTQQDLRDVWVGVNVLNTMMTNPRATQLSVVMNGVRAPVAMARPDRDAIRSLASDLSQRPGVDAFRKRAAVFHMDAALLLVGDSTPSPMYSSFLLPERIFVRTGDGTQGSMHGGDVNWEFARQLLDAVQNVMVDPDVLLWYQASLAYKLWHEQLDTTHFRHALELFPTDAVILRLTGALNEALADARVQSSLTDLSVPRGTRLDVESEESHLRRAEEYFRRALDADPADLESALRYARTLGRLARHEAAAKQLRALPVSGDPLLAYYAHLFLGAEEQALGRHDEAGVAFAKAAALFPRAQAPRVALSQMAHQTGNRIAAREALAQLLQRSGDEDLDDPFWQYRITAGRHRDGLVEAVYRSVASPSRN